jgi:cyclase
MISRRLIVCLDVKGGRVVKGVNFRDLRDLGDPVELATRYEREGADEIVFLDISASAEERAPLLELARNTAERLFIPLTIGGGIRTADDVGRALRHGADKVGLNTAAVEHPEVIRASADRFGAQCVVVSIDAAREGDRWRVYVKGGAEPTDLEAVSWAERCASLGAGELLVTSIDRDGVRTGYDLALTAAIARAVDLPVIASGGAGSARHVVEALEEGQASAALVAGILHDGVTTVRALKEAMIEAGIPTRRTW